MISNRWLVSHISCAEHGMVAHLELYDLITNDFFTTRFDIGKLHFLDMEAPSRLRESDRIAKLTLALIVSRNKTKLRRVPGPGRNVFG